MSAEVLYSQTKTDDRGFYWDGEREEENGHRTYNIKFKVQSDPHDGPYTVMQANGLFEIGDAWDFNANTGTGTGTGPVGEMDQWAFCTPYLKVTPLGNENEGKKCFWIVEQKFTTAPFDQCKDYQVSSPLLKQQKVSGSFVKQTTQPSYDRRGKPILYSSHERITGPESEFEASKPTVHIEQNVLDLNLPVVSRMMDKVNDRTLWGLAKRCVKLSGFSWERNVYGRCYVYFTRIFDFSVDYETFDKFVVDCGTKVLNGHWDTRAVLADGSHNANYGKWTLDKIGGVTPNYLNPTHFIRYKDRNGENARVLLNGYGIPAIELGSAKAWNTGTGTGSGTGTGTGPGEGRADPHRIRIEHYEEENFLMLGVPSNLAAKDVGVWFQT